MADEIKIKVPDIGGATEVDVIDIMVKPGDEISIDTQLITLESDKASMNIPSPQAGKVSSLQVKIGDKVSEGTVILMLVAKRIQTNTSKPVATIPSVAQKAEEKPAETVTQAQSSQQLEVSVPDIGGATNVDVIEIMVSVGQSINKDQSLITLEGDKATMDIPAPVAGVVEEIVVKVGDKVSQGNLILVLKAEQVADKLPETAELPAVEEKQERPVEK